MMDRKNLTAFESERRIAAGDAATVALAIKRRLRAAPDAIVLTFDGETGAVVDFDLSGSDEDVLARLTPEAEPAAPKVGRPKLGVVAREVTLLPRHWDYLKSRPGGASAALRRMVESAIRNPSPQDRARQAQAAADRFMSATLGDQPGYEDAARALYAGDRRAFAASIEGWPADLRDFAAGLAAPSFLDPPPGAGHG